MAKNRLINTRFWDDPFIAELDPTEKLLFLYAITNPLTDLCGAYEITLKRIAMDTGIDRDMIVKIFDRFRQADKVRYENGWVIIKNFAKHQRKNPSIEKGIERSLSECPEWVRNRLWADWGQTGTPKPNLAKHNLSEADSDPTSSRSSESSIVSEADGLLDLIAVETGAKSRATMADPGKWREAAEIVVREQHDWQAFLAIIRTQISETRDNPRYFSAKKCVEILQTKKTMVGAGNSNRATANKAAALAECSLCDEGGLRDYYKPDGSFDRRDICDHK